jgi:DNA-directed RNA polymerase subunit RPC12/RpoP
MLKTAFTQRIAPSFLSQKTRKKKVNLFVYRLSNGNDTHSRTCKRNAEHKETVNCSGGTATCTAKTVCDVCNTTYGTTKEHTTTQYGGKEGSGHWDTCSTCSNKLNFEAHTPDRENADETNDKKCTKCSYVIVPAGHNEHTADSEWHNSADGTYTITSVLTAVVRKF